MGIELSSASLTFLCLGLAGFHGNKSVKNDLFITMWCEAPLSIMNLLVGEVVTLGARHPLRQEMISVDRGGGDRM